MPATIRDAIADLHTAIQESDAAATRIRDITDLIVHTIAAAPAGTYDFEEIAHLMPHWTVASLRCEVRDAQDAADLAAQDRGRERRRAIADAIPG